MEASPAVLSRIAALVAAVCLASPVLAGDDQSEKEQKARKLKRPGLELRISPRFSFSPANVLFTAEIKGGDDVEEYYCPEIEWEWGDGTKSVQESDCDPWSAGTTKMERRFTYSHVFGTSGVYLARVTLRKHDSTIATKSVEVTVQPGAGDQDIYGR